MSLMNLRDECHSIIDRLSSAAVSDAYDTLVDIEREHSRPPPGIPWRCRLLFPDHVEGYVKNAALAAADRLSSIITSRWPKNPDDGNVEGIEVQVRTRVYDGAGGILAFSMATHWRTDNDMPYRGRVYMDVGDVARLHHEGLLERTFLHEMIHAIGFLQIAGREGKKHLVEPPEAGSWTPKFVGESAMREYGALLGEDRVKVPLSHGVVTQGHLAQIHCGGELMNANLRDDKRLSRLSLAILEDLGYDVDYSKAEPYELSPRERNRIDPRWICEAQSDAMPDL